MLRKYDNTIGKIIFPLKPKKYVKYDEEDTLQDRFNILYSKLDEMPSFDLKHHNSNNFRYRVEKA